MRVWLCLLAVLLASTPTRGDEESPVTRLFDAGLVSPQPWTSAALEKLSASRQIPEDQTNGVFSGDAVLMNDKLVVVFRKQGTGAEVYAKTPGGLKPRATLGHAADLKSTADAGGSVKIIENTAGGVVLELGFKGEAASVLRFRLTAGEAIVEVDSTDGAGFIDWRSQGRYLVVPDYFGDDMVLDAKTDGGVCLPTENLCLQLIDGGEAMVMGVWRSRQQEAWLTGAGKDRDGALGPTRIRCLKDQSPWLAFLESPGLWRAAAEPGKITPPFPAKWRASFARRNGVADSWDQEAGPAPEQISGAHAGPFLVYLMDRVPATPLTVTCPTDVMRNTLGVGPCQYILACEGMGAQGDPTPNSVMGWVEKQFEQRKEKKAAGDIKERLEAMTKHVAEARTRIEGYATFATELRKTVAGKIGADSFLPMIDDLDQFSAAGLKPEFGPGPAGQIAGEVSALICGKTRSPCVVRRERGSGPWVRRRIARWRNAGWRCGVSRRRA